MQKLKTILVVIVACLFVTGCSCSKKESYTVTFDTTGGTTISSVTVEDGNVVTKPKDPTKEGYTFAGWYYGDTEYDFNKAVSGNITLTAKWIEDSAVSGEKIAVTSITASKSSITLKVGGTEKLSITVKPSNATDKKVTYKSSDTKVATVSSDGTVTAVKVGSATITATADGKSTIVKVTVTAASNSSSSGTKTNTGTSESTTPETSTPTVTNYTVKFDTVGGTTIADVTVEDGKTVSEPTAPTKKGYTFKGWTLNDSDYSFATAVNSNITLVAKWEGIGYTYSKGTCSSDIGQGQACLIIYLNGSRVNSAAGMFVADATNSWLGDFNNSEKAVILNETKLNSVKKIYDGSSYQNISQQ